MNPEGLPVPQPVSEDPAVLKGEVLRLSRQLQGERQQAAQALAASQAKCKAEMDKLRQVTHQHGRDLENQNAALLKSLGRMQAENDELQKKVFQLEARAGEVPRVIAEPAPTVPIVPATPPLSGEAVPQKQG